MCVALLKQPTKLLRNMTQSAPKAYVFLITGISGVTWLADIVKDSVQENNEKFRVMLKAPTNAVLGENDKATVTIVNLKRDGKFQNYSERQIKILKGQGNIDKREFIVSLCCHPPLMMYFLFLCSFFWHFSLIFMSLDS